MLPPDKEAAFHLRLIDAEWLAVKGKAADGLTSLQAGAVRAEEARTAGEPWGEELLSWYQVAVEWFARRHRVRA
ncbi:MAG: hypothetical protein HY320_06640 [Armatimonadetes bacterium]|nr:hypothetical protein [Armatimonadota bacterium]